MEGLRKSSKPMVLPEFRLPRTTLHGCQFTFISYDKIYIRFGQSACLARVQNCFIKWIPSSWVLGAITCQVCNRGPFVMYTSFVFYHVSLCMRVLSTNTTFLVKVARLMLIQSLLIWKSNWHGGTFPKRAHPHAISLFLKTSVNTH